MATQCQLLSAMPEALLAGTEWASRFRTTSLKHATRGRAVILRLVAWQHAVSVHKWSGQRSCPSPTLTLIRIEAPSPASR
jgi:hypothetical protein